MRAQSHPGRARWPQTSHGPLTFTIPAPSPVIIKLVHVNERTFEGGSIYSSMDEEGFLAFPGLRGCSAAAYEADIFCDGGKKEPHRRFFGGGALL